MFSVLACGCASSDVGQCVALGRIHRPQQLLEIRHLGIVVGHHARPGLAELSVDDGVDDRIRREVAGRGERVWVLGMAQLDGRGDA